MPITARHRARIIWGALWIPPVTIRRSSVRSERRAARKAAANCAGDLPEGGRIEGSRLCPVQQRPAARFLDRGSDPALPEADRAAKLGISPFLYRPGDQRRQRIAPDLSGAARRCPPRRVRHRRRRSARPAVARSVGCCPTAEAAAFRRGAVVHARRGRDRRAACRPQGHDERAVLEGPGRQTAAWARGARAPRAIGWWAVLRL